MQAGKVPQLFLPFGGEPNPYLAPVFSGMNALHQPPRLHAVDQADGAVGPDEQSLGQCSDRGSRGVLVPAHARSSWCCWGSRPAAFAAASLKCRNRRIW